MTYFDISDILKILQKSTCKVTPSESKVIHVFAYF